MVIVTMVLTAIVMIAVGIAIGYLLCNATIKANAESEEFMVSNGTLYKVLPQREYLALTTDRAMLSKILEEVKEPNKGMSSFQTAVVHVKDAQDHRHMTITAHFQGKPRRFKVLKMYDLAEPDEEVTIITEEARRHKPMLREIKSA